MAITGLVGAYVGEFKVAEEYVGDVRVPGCLPNAVCGLPICGTGALCGASWGCAYDPGLILTPGSFRLLNAPLVEGKFRKAALVLYGKSVSLTVDAAIPSRKPTLILFA